MGCPRRGEATEVRVLVTGSSGFLGRHVAEHLASRPGFQVTGFDLQVGSNGAFVSIEGDLCDPDAVRRAARDMDVIVHFAGIGDVDLAAEQPDLAIRANVAGTTNVALASRAVGARLVYASTWEVYGPSRYDPIDERHPCEPHHIYSVTKLWGERVLSALHKHDGLPVVVLRFGTAYGTGMRPNSVFSRFFAAARSGGALIVHGSGRQLRQFTHSSDIAAAVELATSAARGEVILNIAAEAAISILELAEFISHRYSVPVVFAPDRHGDAPSAHISSAKAERVLGWHAEVDFWVGLTELLREAESAPALAHSDG
jgi:nucleoside-diphosphate-sugar epimerase